MPCNKPLQSNATEEMAVKMTLILLWTALMGAVTYKLIEDYVKKERFKHISDLAVGAGMLGTVWIVGVGIIEWVSELIS